MGNNRKEEPVEWGGWLNEFLWVCAGVNRKVLRLCPTDYAKYAGMGGTILFTACMAMLSGGYALFTVFKNETAAVVFGIFWGLLIFNLDRFIVNTMYSDGKVTISRKEFTSGLPRIIMAVFLGIVISTPLELKIYEDGINNEIEHMKTDELNKRMARLDTQINNLEQRREEIESRNDVSAGVGGFEATNSQLGQTLNGLQARLRSLNDKIRSKQMELRRYSAVHNPGQYQNVASQIRALKNQRNNISHQIRDVSYNLSKNSDAFASAIRTADNQKQQELKTINDEIAKLTADRDGQNKVSIQKLEDELTGFQGRMHAFNRMKDEDESTYVAALFISLLFIVIETTPTFFKMMIASGPYDDMLRAEMHRIRVLADKNISDLNDEVNTLVTISTEKNKAQIEAELDANKELTKRVTLAQAELLQTAIDAWKAEELKKIEASPSSYLQIETSKSATEKS